MPASTPASPHGAELDAPSSGFVVRENRAYALFLLVAGAIGFAAAVVLLIEKITIIADPTYVPTCSINPILSCGSVMQTEQAEVFGFPNPILGVAGFAIVATTGAALLAGAGLRRWYWLGLQGGTILGVAFVHWLAYQSLYRIGALCPYCMVVWAVTIPLFWYTTLHNITAGHLPTPSSLRQAAKTAVGYHGVVLTTWYLTITTAVAFRFWDYWSSLLS